MFVRGQVLLFLLSWDLVADVVHVFVLLDLLELVAGEVVGVFLDYLRPFVWDVGLVPFGRLCGRGLWTGYALFLLSL